jgi:hypothetical protein
VIASFTPQIPFALGPLELQPAAAAATSSAPPASSFHPSAVGSIAGASRQPLRLSLGLARPTVATARMLVLAAIAAVLLGAIVALLVLSRHPRGEVAAIRARFGHLMVSVAHVRRQPGVAIIDVSDIEALVLIAERYDRAILHERRGDGESFWVADESGQFRYAPALETAMEDVFQEPAPDAPALHPPEPEPDTIVLEDGRRDAPPPAAAAESGFSAPDSGASAVHALVAAAARTR